MSKKTFQDVAEGSEFVYKNCLFEKVSGLQGKQKGSQHLRTFKQDDEVGVVMASAKAPVPETVDHEDNSQKGEDQ